VLGLVLGCPVESWSDPSPLPSGLEEFPSAKREDVTRLLRKVRRRHGEDAVVIQTHLLLNAMQRGSVLSTGVRVDSVEERFDKRYLAFELETGIVFDDSTRDEALRVQTLWVAILEPTLARLTDGLQVAAADGIVVRMQYHHRPYRSVADLHATIDQPGTSEETRFAVLAADVDAVVRKELTLRDLFRRVRVLVDGAERSVPLPVGEALTPGPD
jgi:hypothetical protein